MTGKQTLKLMASVTVGIVCGMLGLKGLGYLHSPATVPSQQTTASTDSVIEYTAPGSNVTIRNHGGDAAIEDSLPDVTVEYPKPEGAIWTPGRSFRDVTGTSLDTERGIYTVWFKESGKERRIVIMLSQIRSIEVRRPIPTLDICGTEG